MATPDTVTTVIGGSVHIKGNLSGEEDLHVLGRVEGSIGLDRTLVVAESGIVKAEVKVRNAVISGVVVGNVHASESVEITREGRMVGDISAPRVIIVDGASFRGNVDMGDIDSLPARRPTAERPRPIPAPRPAARTEPAKPAPKEAAEKEEAKAEPQKVEETATETVPVQASGDKKNRPRFLEPPKAKGLPKKSKMRVVVKRR